jgi:hypothetical protein
MSWRMKRAGCTNAFAPDAVVRSHGDDIPFSVVTPGGSELAGDGAPPLKIGCRRVRPERRPLTRRPWSSQS